MTTTKPTLTTRSLPEFFLDWRQDFVPGGEFFSPLNFLNQQAAIPFLISAAWLFCPEVTEYRGGVFRVARFDPENVDQWLADTAGEVSRTEAVVNELHVYSLFGNCDIDAYSDAELMQFAMAIGECWQGVLTRRFPAREVVVEVSGEEDGEYGPTITFYTRPGT
ncbi:hypothetical protein [Spirillospora albida]|uniref:hypothetical protein n=1 Tax=Spirillospora albida TaxID=58123 RepID=UPI0004C0E6E8|nr:hypothetical protein [Spirillospora albida]